jgi:hypothetical protein
MVENQNEKLRAIKADIQDEKAYIAEKMAAVRTVLDQSISDEKDSKKRAMLNANRPAARLAAAGRQARRDRMPAELR